MPAISISSTIPQDPTVRITNTIIGYPKSIVALAANVNIKTPVSTTCINYPISSISNFPIQKKILQYSRMITHLDTCII